MAAVTAAVVGAVASVASSGIGAASSAGAFDKGGGGGGKPDFTRVPRAPYEEGLASYNARLLAANEATAQPVSFADFLSSGGKARVQLKDVGFTPKEAQELGLVGQLGQEVPYFDPDTQNKFTPEQAIYRGKQKLGKNPYSKHPLAYYARREKRIGKITERLEGDTLNENQRARAEARLKRIKARQARATSKYDIGPEV